jgi:hypothetical protein
LIVNERKRKEVEAKNGVWDVDTLGDQRVHNGNHNGNVTGKNTNRVFVTRHGVELEEEGFKGQAAALAYVLRNYDVKIHAGNLSSGLKESGTHYVKKHGFRFRQKKE